MASRFTVMFGFFFSKSLIIAAYCALRSSPLDSNWAKVIVALPCAAVLDSPHAAIETATSARNAQRLARSTDRCPAETWLTLPSRIIHPVLLETCRGATDSGPTTLPAACTRHD